MTGKTIFIIKTDNKHIIRLNILTISANYYYYFRQQLKTQLHKKLYIKNLQTMALLFDFIKTLNLRTHMSYTVLLYVPISYRAYILWPIVSGTVHHYCSFRGRPNVVITWAVFFRSTIVISPEFFSEFLVPVEIPDTQVCVTVKNNR